VTIKLSQDEQKRIEELAHDPIKVISQLPLFPSDHLTLAPNTGTVQFWGGKVPSLHSFVLFALVSAQASYGNEQTGDFAVPYAVLFVDTLGDLGEQAHRFKALCSQAMSVFSAASGQTVEVKYSPVLAAPDLIREMHKHKCVVIQDPSIEKGFVTLTYRLTAELEQKIRVAMIAGTLELDRVLAEWAAGLGLPQDAIKEIQLRSQSPQR
jgi:hypothetical protein